MKKIKMCAIQANIGIFIIVVLAFNAKLHQTNAHYNYGNGPYLAQQNSYKGDVGLQKNTQFYSVCPSDFTGLLPYAKDCHSFLNCYQGQTHIQNCGPGTVFNSATLQCDRADSSQACNTDSRVSQIRSLPTDIDQMCATNYNGLLAHPQDCTKFIQCDNGKAHEKICGPGTAFDAHMMVCDFEEKVKCHSPINKQDQEVSASHGAGKAIDVNLLNSNEKVDLLCPPGMSGNFPHPFDNQRFLVCVLGQTGIQNCEPNTVYSISKKRCINKNEMLKQQDCVAHNLAEENYNNPLTLVQCPPQMEGIYVYPYSDRKMLKCENRNMQIMECPFGYKFNHARLVCELQPNKYMSAQIPQTIKVPDHSHKGFVNPNQPTAPAYEPQSSLSNAYQPNPASTRHQSRGSSIYPPNTYDPQSTTVSDHAHKGFVYPDQPTGPANSYDPQSPNSNAYQPNPASTRHQSRGSSIYPQTSYEPQPTTVSDHSHKGFVYPDQPTAPAGSYEPQSSLSNAYQPSPASTRHQSKGSSIYPPNSYDPESTTVSEHAYKGFVYPDQPTIYTGHSVPQNSYNSHQGSYEPQSPLSNDYQPSSDPYRPQSTVSNVYHPDPQSSNYQPSSVVYPPPTIPSSYEFKTPRKNLYPVPSLYSPNPPLAPLDKGFQSAEIPYAVPTRPQSPPSVIYVQCPQGELHTFPHPFDNTKYLTCRNQQLKEQDCSSGQVFSLRDNQCRLQNTLTINDYVPISKYIHNQEDLISNGQIMCPQHLNGKFLHPFDEKQLRYLSCQNGQIIIESCEQNTKFDAAQAQCVPYSSTFNNFNDHQYPRIEEVYNETPISCPHGLKTLQSEAVFHPYPFANSFYLICQFETTNVRSCNRGRVFEIGQRSCVPGTVEDQYGIESSGSNKLLCPPTATGKFIYPFDSQKFISCQNGHTCIKECPPGQLFSLTWKDCFEESTVPETDRVTFNLQVAQQETPNPPAVYKTEKEVDYFEVLCKLSEEGSNQPHPHNCTKYVECKNGKSLVKSCRRGNSIKACDLYNSQKCHQFQNAKLLSCDSRGHFLAAHPDSCQQFLYCAHGIVYEQKCPRNTYWDNTEQVCDFRENVYCEEKGILNEYPTSTIPNVHYAQPVGSEEDSAEVFNTYNKNYGNTHAANVPQHQINRVSYTNSYDRNDHHNDNARSRNLNPVHNNERQQPQVVSRFGQEEDNSDDSKQTYLQPPIKNLAPLTDMRNLKTQRSDINPQLTPSYSRVLHMKPQESATDVINKQVIKEALSLLLKPYSSSNNQTSTPALDDKHILSVTSTQSPRIKDTEFITAGEQFHLAGQAEPLQLKTKHASTMQERSFNKDYQTTERIEIITLEPKEENETNDVGVPRVRLSGGFESNIGRLEVEIAEEWGYVCGDNFGKNEAQVVCRELGFNLDANKELLKLDYTASDLRLNFLLRDVKCAGNETSLKDCKFSKSKLHECQSRQLVRVDCKKKTIGCPKEMPVLCKSRRRCIDIKYACNGHNDCKDNSDESPLLCTIKYRLNGGRRSNEGRLELKYLNEWGTVCGKHFGLNEAKVVCRSLGYLGEARIVNNMYGTGSGRIWLDNVSCSGNETSLDQCFHYQFGLHNCKHSDDVNIHCGIDSKDDNDIGLYSYNELNVEKRCGQIKAPNAYLHRQKRIVNGRLAQPGQHPWQASIRIIGIKDSNHFCGGVLISKLHVLTSAHCIDGFQKTDFLVRLGEHNNHLDEKTEMDVLIADWYKHEKFRHGGHSNNDIALILLKNKISYTDYIQPICLPSLNSQLLENSQCRISGWGSSVNGSNIASIVLMTAEVEIMSDEDCVRAYSQSDQKITNNMFCAGSVINSADSCHGDSGGPLACTNDYAETLYGLISWGEKCGAPNKPGVYLRVENYLDWILEKMNTSIN